MRRGVYRGWDGELASVVDEEEEEEEDIFLGFDVSQCCSDTIKNLQSAEYCFVVFPVQLYQEFMFCIYIQEFTR